MAPLIVQFSAPLVALKNTRSGARTCAPRWRFWCWRCLVPPSPHCTNFWKWKTKKGTSRELRQRNQDSLNTGASKMRHVQNIQSYRDRAPQQSNSLGGRMCHIDYSTFLKPISYQTGVRLIDSSAWLRAPISNGLYQGLCGILHPASRQARRAYLYVIGASQLFRSL